MIHFAKILAKSLIYQQIIERSTYVNMHKGKLQFTAKYVIYQGCYSVSNNINNQQNHLKQGHDKFG